MAEHGTRDIWFEGVFMRNQISTADSGGSVSVMEQWLPPNYSPPAHVHTREDQVLYVLVGEIIARLGGPDDPTTTVKAGGAIFLPRNVPHCFVSGPEGAKLLEINTPGGFEQFHVDAGEPAAEVRIPDPTEPDVPKLVAAIAPYEAEFVGPPMS